MSNLELSFHFDGPFEADRDERITDFYEANGYQRRDAEGDTSERAHRLERGERNAGWTTSCMCDLFAQVTVELDEERLSVRYVVDVAGQHITEEDRAFWAQEAERAAEHVRGGPLYDLREAERRRAERTRAETIRTALFGSMMVVLIVFALVVFASSLGLI
jgi:hypothetical protein